MVIDDLLRKFNKAGHNAEGFVILLIGKFESTLCTLMISVISIVGKWCTDNGMSINEQKTKLVLFTTKRKLSRMNLPKLNAVELSLAEVTFLVF